jgi:hypothetical protein
MRSGQLSPPLAPHARLFWVAPAEGRALSTATSGPARWGTWDCRGLVSGVTVYFPVAVARALLFAGNGHALGMAKSLEQGSKSHLIYRDHRPHYGAVESAIVHSFDLVDRGGGVW